MPKKLVSKKRSSRPRRRMMRPRRSLPLKYQSNRVGGNNTCRIETTIPTVTLLANTPYQFNLAGIVGSRAVDVAPNFALYRVAKVLFKYKPLFDTYIPSQAGGTPSYNYITGVPTLYWKMNRFADDPNNFTSDNLRVMGAKPIRFDDKQYTLSYKPNILTSQATGGSDSGAVKITPWLNTDTEPDSPTFHTSTTQHYGHFWYIEAATVNNSTYPQIGTLDVTIFYEFKNPRVEWTQTQTDTSGNPVIRKITVTGGEQPSVTTPALSG